MATLNDLIVDNNNLLIVYTGTWGVGSNASHYGGTMQYTSTTSSYAVISVRGTRIKLYGYTASLYGIAQLYFDGVSQGTLDFYSAVATFQQLMWDSGDVAAGAHVLRLEYTGTKNASSTGYTVDIDYIVVTRPNIAELNAWDDDQAVNIGGIWSNHESLSAVSTYTFNPNENHWNYTGIMTEVELTIFMEKLLEIEQTVDSLFGGNIVIEDNTPSAEYYTMNFYSDAATPVLIKSFMVNKTTGNRTQVS